MIFVLLLFTARPLAFIAYHSYKETLLVNLPKKGYANDVSQLNETLIKQVIPVAKGRDEAAAQLCGLVKSAAITGKKISIAGARHSMGGHTVYPKGIIVDMRSYDWMELDASNNILTVGAGAFWAKIIPYLNQYGKSVAVMQANNSFSVGGSLSVNCHGWQAHTPPIVSTVESFRLVNAKGEVVKCSRQSNKELFSLALGGYGLFGIILDVELRVVENPMYRLKSYLIDSEDYMNRYEALIDKQSQVGMVYGRINVNPAHFMEEALLSFFYIDSNATPIPLTKVGFEGLRGGLFRGSVSSEYGKNLRWKVEKGAAHLFSGKRFLRNQLINEGVELIQNSQDGYTDILHEYFIPREAVGRFIKALKVIIPQYPVNLLNITLRHVSKDRDTYLPYAQQDVLGFVMLYHQAKNPAAEKAMKALTQRLIDEAIALKGTYYLPYRLHATKVQMYTAYPMASRFFLLKRKYDPNETFQNLFYEAYK